MYLATMEQLVIEHALVELKLGAAGADVEQTWPAGGLGEVKLKLDMSMWQLPAW